MRARFGVAFELFWLQASLFAILREGRVRLLCLHVDRVELLSEVVMVLKSVNHAINPIARLLHELVVVLMRLDRVHVASRVQQVAQLRLNVLLFCHVDTEFDHNFLLLLKPLVEPFYLPCSIGTEGALLVEGV